MIYGHNSRVSARHCRYDSRSWISHDTNKWPNRDSSMSIFQQSIFYFFSCWFWSLLHCVIVFADNSHVPLTDLRKRSTALDAWHAIPRIATLPRQFARCLVRREACHVSHLPCQTSRDLLAFISRDETATRANYDTITRGDVQQRASKTLHSQDNQYIFHIREYQWPTPRLWWRYIIEKWKKIFLHIGRRLEAPQAITSSF